MFSRLRPIALFYLMVLACCVPPFSVATHTNSFDVSSYTTNTSDSLTFRIAAELLHRGRSPYSEEERRAHVSSTRLSGRAPPYDLPFAYPPNALPMFALLALGAPGTAHARWVLVTAAFMFAALLVLLRRYKGEDGLGQELVWMLSLSVSFPSLFNAGLGQTGFLLAGCAFMFAAFYRDRPLLAGIALGLMAFKPQYALVLAILPIVERNTRLLFSASSIVVAMSALSAALFGIDMWPQFIDSATSSNHTTPYMVSLPVVLRHLIPMEQTARVALVIFAGVVVSLFVLFRSLVKRGVSTERMIAIAVCAVLLFSPNTHPYDLTLMTIPVLFATLGANRIVSASLGFGHTLVTWIPPLFTVQRYYLMGITAAWLAFYLCATDRRTGLAPIRPCRRLRYFRSHRGPDR